jgi:hypothetical protein
MADAIRKRSVLPQPRPILSGGAGFGVHFKVPQPNLVRDTGNGKLRQVEALQIPTERLAGAADLECWDVLAIALSAAGDATLKFHKPTWCGTQRTESFDKSKHSKLPTERLAGAADLECWDVLAIAFSAAVDTTRNFHKPTWCGTQRTESFDRSKHSKFPPSA